MRKSKRTRIIPDSILQRLTPEQRKEIGQLTAEESRLVCERRTEAALQKQCETWLTYHNITFLHLSYRAREKVGWPDLVFVIDGKPFAIELKTATGRLTADQLDTLENMRINGWNTAVVRSLAEFKVYLDETSNRSK